MLLIPTDRKALKRCVMLTMREPITIAWPNPTTKTYFFAKNLVGFKAKKGLKIKGNEEWFGTPQWTLEKVAAGNSCVVP